jgi:NAD(P)-dependent dehydrogenase (short-subunit alcohol dehydrogenase family)
MAREGASVVIADRDEAAGVATLEIITGLGGRGLTMTVDTSEARGVETLIRRAADCFGRPGPTRTPFMESVLREQPELLPVIEAAQPIGRVGQSSEIAEAVVWLCSDRASFVSGATLPVDGGFVAQ